jgi:phytoene synthase
VSPGSARDRLDDLRRRTDEALAGRPSDDTVFVALRRVVERHRIPPEHPHALLDGFAMDVEQRRYESLEDTLEYCYHVAGVVGVMMALTMDAREPEALDRASDLGLALQMTNISRDVMDDAEVGRVYLPRDWLRSAGVPPEEIRDARHRRAVAGVVRRFLQEADRYYRSSASGLPFLSLRCAWSIATARDVYRDIGRLVLRRGEHAWDHRAVVGKPRKLFRVAVGAVDAIAAKSIVRHRRPRSRAGLWTRPRASNED